MFSRLSRAAFSAALMLTVVTTAVAQPDVIVGDITGPSNYTASATHDAFSLGTTSCNIGSSPLTWISNTNQHPVIGGNLYRYDPANNGRFTMVGMSWLKHGFFALQQSLCGSCQPNPNGSALGVGCSDPYTSNRNGSQSGLGPRWQVNATTGDFPYGPANPAYSGATARRLRVPLGELDTSSIYVSEAQYIQYEDALANSDDNNASYRLSQVSGGPTNYSLNFTAPTVREQPAIMAWAAIDPGVVIQSGVATTSGGGLFHVGVKRIENGNGTYRFEYCVQNLNSHDSGGAFSVNFANGVAITNAGFHAPEWHSGSILDNNAWVVSTASNGVTFSVDQGFSQNPNSNALRWSTAFSFWFDSSDPNPLGASIDLYRVSGQVSFPAPPFPAEVWEVNSSDASLAVDGNGTNDPFVGPIQLGLASGTNHTATLGGAAGQPYQLYLQFTPAVPDYYTSADGETVNLNLGDPSFSPFFSGAPIMPAGGLNVPFNATGTFFLAGQAYCANPTNIEGFSLSAAMELDVMPLPRVVVEVVGSNSYTADTNGFWRVHHNGTTPANITDVTFDLSPVAAYFDTDQGMPSGSGSFAAGQTYAQNTDVSTGLNYAVSSPNAGSGWIGTNNTGGANYNTVEFRFTGGQFNGNSFLFNADTDPGTQTAGDHAGAAITVTLSNGDVLTGTLAVDPSSSNRVFVELQ